MYSALPPAIGSHLYLTTDGGASWHRASF